MNIMVSNTLLTIAWCSTVVWTTSCYIKPTDNFLLYKTKCKRYASK